MAGQMTAKPVNQRVDELRARRKALGLERLELYVHPDDKDAVKRKAASLQRAREKEKQK
jgi:hypothetical protein